MTTQAAPHIRCLITRITVDGAAKAIEFYKAAFGAEELFRFETDGRVGHSELRIGGTLVSIADPWPGAPAAAPGPKGNPHSGFLAIVDDADGWLARAKQHGATVIMEAQDTFYGHRCGVVLDPFGQFWNLSQVKEIVSDAEMRRRLEEMMKNGGVCGASRE